MERSLTHVEVGRTDPAVARQLLLALRAALDGTGPAIAPRPPAPQAAPSRHPGLADGPAVPETTALVVATSGSTGHPRHVLLGRDALLASAAATHERLGGPGRWVLALPLTHIAGLQVLVRSLAAGTDPVTVPAAGGFDPRRLAEAVRDAATSSGPLYTSLVPTQLHRVVSAARGPGLPAGLSPLLDLDAVLVGGGGTSAHLLERAVDLGLRVVTTYGMTETAGGCVYDGVPLDGARVEVTEGVVRLAGPMLATGYADGDDSRFCTDPAGTRWFRTDDLGQLDSGRLQVLGRADDVVVTGGVKVAAGVVEDVVARLPGVGQVCVVGVPDPEWGHVVVAVVVASGGGSGPLPSREQLRAEVARTLGSAAAPRHLLVVDALPDRGPGKVDRARTAVLATAALAAATSAGRAGPRGGGTT